MKILRLLLFPFSIIYALIIWLRNRLFDFKILKSKTFDIPTIVVGNLAIGGTGKSPMTEFIIKSLKDNFNVATLSRGYGRKTKGFRFVETNSTANDVGDEPLQFKNKFPDITVSVCEDRCTGIETIKKNHDAIILDDAFQHRKLKPTFSFLLFEYYSCLKPMLVLPSGNFRDLPGEAKRADMIIVTKTPKEATAIEKEKIKQRLFKLSRDKPVFFSEISYGNIIPIQGNITMLNNNTTVILVTGIVNPKPLVQYLNLLVQDIIHLQYADHHNFDLDDIHHIKESFDRVPNFNKIILTTEKDAQRLNTDEFLAHLQNTVISYIPIEIQFSEDDKSQIQGQLHTIANRSVNQS